MKRRPRVYRGGCLNFRRDCRRYSDGTERTGVLSLYFRPLPSYRPFRIALHFCSRYPLSSFSPRTCNSVYICIRVCVYVTFLRRVTHAFACLSLYFHFRRTSARPLGFSLSLVVFSYFLRQVHTSRRFFLLFPRFSSFPSCRPLREFLFSTLFTFQFSLLVFATSGECLFAMSRTFSLFSSLFLFPYFSISLLPPPFSLDPYPMLFLSFLPSISRALNSTDAPGHPRQRRDAFRRRYRREKILQREPLPW